MSLYGNNLFYFIMVVLLFALQLFWKAIPILQEDRLNRGAASTDILFYLCFSLSVGMLFRLFPGNERAPIEDSSVFLYIGKRMVEGKVPYRDLFDHKGPVLYLIQYLGMILPLKEFTGVWLLEILNVLLTAYMAKKLSELITDQRECSYLAIMAAIGVCGWKVWQGGNYTEEYALPWITLALSIYLAFFQTGQFRKTQIVMIGFSFAVVFLLRANMVGVWAILTPFVLLKLLMQKRFQDIGSCVVMFVLGMILVLLPVLLWAAMKDMLRSMWETYILFNIQYTDEIDLSLLQRLKLVLDFMKVLWPGTAAILISMIMHPRSSPRWANLLAYLFSAYTAAMSGRLYYHYAIVMLPMTIPAFADLFSWTAALLRRKQTKKTQTKTWALSAVFVLMLIASVSYRMLDRYVAEDDPVTDYLQTNTEKSQDVLILGNSSWYYLLADRKTDNRFFYQTPPMEISSELRESFRAELAKHPSDYIVVPGEKSQREWTKTQVGNLEEVLEKINGENNYRKEAFDTFEVLIRQRENANE